MIQHHDNNRWLTTSAPYGHVLLPVHRLIVPLHLPIVARITGIICAEAAHLLIVGERGVEEVTVQPLAAGDVLQADAGPLGDGTALGTVLLQDCISHIDWGVGRPTVVGITEVVLASAPRMVHMLPKLSASGYPVTDCWPLPRPPP
jgi:hypothetical protein